MAALRGTLQGNRGETSRLGSKASGITARLNTWNGAITVDLEADGSFRVFVSPDNGPRSLIRGNVDTGEILPTE